MNFHIDDSELLTFGVPKMTQPEIKALHMNELRSKYANCRRCQLCNTRRNLVFGAGNPDALVMCITGATNWFEDEEGYPAAGNGAPFFVKAMRSIQLELADVYCTAMVKCLPPKSNPNDRNSPRVIPPDSVERCRPIIMRQIEIIRPAAIVCQGRAASELLLEDERTLGKYAGHFRIFGDKCFVLSTWSPGLVSMKPEIYESEYLEHWQQLAYRLEGLGRMWRPDADLYKRGWKWDLGLPSEKTIEAVDITEGDEEDEP